MELLGRVADEVTADWVLALHRDGSFYVLTVNDNMRLADLRRWMGTHLMDGLRPKGKPTGQLMGLMERAICSPRCALKMQACDENGREYRWPWKALLIQFSEESYEKLYS